MASLIDRLPLDVWHIVLQYACTDGGRSGAALAHTSSGLHTASAASQARAAHPGGDTPEYGLNARHLLLSFFPEDCESLVRPWRGWNEYGRVGI
ncbi:hypothetical protein BD413DRAFT_614197 [Trametes elegans]|nr:hypothetical protein BD413DRAFT_614197 [Trametes elegans]